MLLLGVDAGGSTTVAALADEQGEVLALAQAGRGNFQGPGLEAARAEVQRSIELAAAQAGVGTKQITSAYFGMAGADRPRDFELVRELLTPIVPPQALWGFENDALLGLWAGTRTGVGVAAICGTGTNVVGVNAQGKKVQVGGMGTIFGDYAGGRYIGELALARSQRSVEGRGEPTVLYERLCQHYQVRELLDLVDWLYAGRDLQLAELAPLVVEAAAEGDAVAWEILFEVGEELAVSALAATRQLFEPGAAVDVVAMGSVFQKARHPLLFSAFAQRLLDSEYEIQAQLLRTEPVVGALLAAARQAGLEVTAEFAHRVEESLKDYLPKKE
ncbi:MAG: hypothetical protein GX199_02495 [Firmicutes bacterium]|nr:hypothetical protein [Bacillota bacterium]